MKRIELGSSGVESGEVALGCMRIGGMADADLDALIETCLECGIDLVDHADIYGSGRCEEVFGAALRRLGIARERWLIQSKCGIRRGFYDSSKEHILTSVEAILARLDCGYLDFLLLHRPDALIEPADVSEAFQRLSETGKVLHFGVSNFNPGQIELLQDSLPMPLHVNQMQFGIAHSSLADRGVNVNLRSDGAVDRDGGALDYCRLKRMTIQAWSPFQHGFIAGPFLDNPDYAELNSLLEEIADSYGVSKSGLAIAWIQRHPARIQSIVGTTKPERIREVAAGCQIELSREDWYRIYRAAGNDLP